MSKTYTNFALALSRTSNPDTAMKEFVLERGNHVSELVSLLIFDWRTASAMMNKLVAHLSMWITVDDEPLVFKIVDKALSSYKEAVFNTYEPKRDDPDRLIAFLDPLITETIAAGCFVVRDKRQIQPEWSVGCSIPFPAWVEGANGHVEIINVERRPQPGLHRTLYELLTDGKDRHILRRYGYEATALAGSNHPGD